MFSECLKIQHISSRCWRANGNAVVLGQTGCLDGTVFRLEGGKLKVSGLCLARTSQSSGGGYVTGLASCTDSNVISGIVALVSGMLKWSGGYLLNSGGKLQAGDGTSIIAYGDHANEQRVYQIPIPTECPGKTIFTFYMRFFS